MTMRNVRSPLPKISELEPLFCFRSSTYVVDLLYQMTRARKKEKMRIKDSHSLVIATKLVL